MTPIPRLTLALSAALAGLALAAPAAQASETAAQQACLYTFQRSGEQNTGPGGRVIRSHRSGGAWDIVILDQAEMPWECRARDDGYVEYLRRDPTGRAGQVRDDRDEGRRDRDDKDRGGAGDERWGEETREARQACREAVRARSGRGGLSIRQVEVSQANTLVLLDDEGEKGTWRCLASNRGQVAELTFRRD
ncbi:MAG: hypothetical protein ACU0DT_11375 [Albimonas sp.]|uniref:hypothetical protein n=1 Tax=Albimonas sp. TaxID=1872425 RepID=UPI004056A5D3